MVLVHRTSSSNGCRSPGPGTSFPVAERGRLRAGERRVAFAGLQKLGRGPRRAQARAAGACAALSCTPAPSTVNRKALAAAVLRGTVSSVKVNVDSGPSLLSHPRQGWILHDPRAPCICEVGGGRRARRRTSAVTRDSVSLCF